MTERIVRRRAGSSGDMKRIEDLMKSISNSQSLVKQHNVSIASDIVELYGLMKAAKVGSHRVEDIVADVYRPSGKSSTYIDPAKFREEVKDDAEFYSAISVSVTGAKKVLPLKQLAKIAVVTPARIGEETVRVKRG